ncbi:MAG: hypothetical protein VYE18_05150 [Pseudomonadota bacterium]|nr:hypothetical protein [Pseudomonadota bacterium]
MVGVHDIGGLPAGRMVIEDHEMEPWFKLLNAVAGSLRARGHTTIHEMRRCLENLPQDVYDRGYAERWSEALCDLLEEKRILAKSEVLERVAAIRVGAGSKS